MKENWNFYIYVLSKVKLIKKVNFNELMRFCN